MNDTLKSIKEKAGPLLEQVAYIIGYGAGYDPLHVRPVFIKSKEELDKLVWNRFCIHNLSTYLPPLKNPQVLDPEEKIGVVVKGCDSRSILSLMQENAIDRDRLVILGVPCEGMIDLNKLEKRYDIHKTNKVELNKETIKISGEAGEETFDVKELLYDKCLLCEYPNPLIYDELVTVGGEEKGAEQASGGIFSLLSELEEMSLEEREAYWKKEFARCIRCNACRNVCPLCYCQNQCLLDSRTPHWVKERVDAESNRWYHLIRAFHLAGRCTECGECARVCPVQIPVNLLPMKMNMDLFELFGWRSGVKDDEKPPLMCFKMEEDKIE